MPPYTVMLLHFDYFSRILSTLRLLTLENIGFNKLLLIAGYLHGQWKLEDNATKRKEIERDTFINTIINVDGTTKR